MRDKLIDLIQNAVGGCARHWAELIADSLIANGVTFAKDNNVPCKWIPVSERLPERAISITGKRTCPSSDEVLVYVERTGAMLVAEYWHYEDIWLEITEELSIDGVTHWMPIEPPKEDKP